MRSACFWIAGVLALTTAGAVLAAEPPADDQPQATAPSVGAAEQIQAFIKSAPEPAVRGEAPDGIIETVPDRRIHGEVEVAAGTHGYRSVYAETDGPLGDGGHFSMAVGEGRERGLGPVAGCYTAGPMPAATPLGAGGACTPAAPAAAPGQ